MLKGHLRLADIVLYDTQGGFGDAFETIEALYNELTDYTYNNYYNLKINKFFTIKEIITNIYTKLSTEEQLEIFERSNDFNEADILFNEMIEPNINDYNVIELGRLIKSSLNNSQIYNRRNFKDQVHIMNGISKRKYRKYKVTIKQSYECGMCEIITPLTRIEKVKMNFFELKSKLLKND